MELCKSCCHSDESKEVVVGVRTADMPGTSVNFNLEVMSPPVSAVAQNELPYSGGGYANTDPSPDLVPAAKDAAKINLPPPKKSTVTVDIAKTHDQDLGLDVDFGDKTTLKVVKVKAGLIFEFNKTAKIHAESGDRITGVNGISGTTDVIISEIQRASHLSLTVLKDRMFDFSMMKKNAHDPIGLDLDVADGKVLKVKEGPVADYNNGLAPNLAEFQLQAGDTIREVNRITIVDDFIEELKTKGRLDIVVTRP